MKIDALPDQMLVSAFMDNIPDHIWFMDGDGRYLSVSRSAAQSVGRSVEEVLGKTDFDFIDEAQAQAYRERYLKVMRTGEPIVDYVVKDAWPDGRETWSLSSIAPLRDDQGDIVGVFSVSKDITSTKVMERDLERANRDLREVSRLAGMAEAATGVVHNVGNVMNGVNVSTNLLAQGIRKLKVEQLGKLCGMLRQHADNLADFMTAHSQGRHVIEFLEAFHGDLSASQAQMLSELGSLEQCVSHIKEIVSIQQSYATMKGLVEDIEVEGIVEDALKMSQGAFLRHGVQIRRQFEQVPKITSERGKILQILHNLLRNAKHALDESSVAEKAIEIGIDSASPGMVRVVVSDNGVGIPPENLTR